MRPLPITSPDPAERTWLRFFYRNRRPTLFSWWARIGLPPRFLVAFRTAYPGAGVRTPWWSRT